jgi:hypothetical protein
MLRYLFYFNTIHPFKKTKEVKKMKVERITPGCSHRARIHLSRVICILKIIEETRIHQKVTIRAAGPQGLGGEVLGK